MKLVSSLQWELPRPIILGKEIVILQAYLQMSFIVSNKDAEWDLEDRVALAAALLLSVRSTW
jgi:hypothetical protein